MKHIRRAKTWWSGLSVRKKWLLGWGVAGLMLVVGVGWQWVYRGWILAKAPAASPAVLGMETQASPSPTSSPNDAPPEVVPCDEAHLLAGECHKRGAHLVMVLPSVTPTAMPNATPTATPQATSTPSLTLSPTPGNSPIPTPTPSPSVSPSLIPSPTPAPSISPTPTSTPTPAPSPNPGADLVTNGNFLDGLIAWDAHGDATLLTTTEDNAVPRAVNMIRLGSFVGDDWLSNNQLSQTIQLPVQNASEDSPTTRMIYFHYQIRTQENLPGFDEPALLVLANNQRVFAKWASEVTTDVSWQLGIINLSQFAAGPVTLTFYAGNTGDDLQPSFVYLTNITSLSTLEDAQKLADAQKYTPAAQNVQITTEKDDYTHVTLNWFAPATAPGDTYDIRVSGDPIPQNISDADWARLAPPAITTTDGLPGTGPMPPLPAGQAEYYQVELPPFGDHFFAVRIKR